MNTSTRTDPPGVRGPTIRLANGHYWDYKRPEAGRMDIESVATALANTCRFTGQIEHFYSVAQHCFLASYIVPPQWALKTLGHEPEEPVTGDVNKPLKIEIEEMSNGEYGRFVERQERPVLAKVFGLDPDCPKPPCIKHADLVMLATEKRDLGPTRRAIAWDAYGFACAWEPLPDEDWTGLEHIQPLARRIRPWTPDQARTAFLRRYLELRFGVGVPPGEYVPQEGLLLPVAAVVREAVPA